MIIFTKEDYKRIVDYCMQCLPYEACGLLGGIKEGADIYIKKVYMLSNADKREDHFTMEPSEQFAAVKDMRANGLELVGNYHSHPTAPARPSQEDIRLAYDHNLFYGIVSLLDKCNPIFNVFYIDENEAVIQEKVLQKSKVNIVK